MTTLLTIYVSVVALLAFLRVVAIRQGHTTKGWVSFILLWPVALPVACLLWTRRK